MMDTHSSRERGLTLVELLVAIVSMVVILGAATGLAITAIARQKVAFDASRLEATHTELAKAIFYAIKTADSFQIFDDASSANLSSIRSYGVGSSSGDYLSCRHSLIDAGGPGELVEQDYEFVRTSTDGSGTLVRTVRFPSSGRHEIRREFAGVIAARPIFSIGKRDSSGALEYCHEPGSSGFRCLCDASIDAMNDKRTFKPRHLSDRGSILVIVIAGIAVASVIVGSYLLFIDDQRERSARGGDDTVTQIRLEENVFRIQREIELGVTTKGEIDLSEISSDMRSLPDALSSPAWLKLTLNGYEGGIASIESFANPSTSLASLENHGDPFLGARASVLSVGIESSAFTLRNIQSRLSYKKVVLTPRIDVRAIPVSQFTVFTLGTGLAIDSANFAGPVGRIFASRDIQFSGNFSTNYPIVSGGNISMEEPLTVSLDANSPIQFRSGQIAYAQPGDSDQAAWLAEARTQYNSTIINPGSLPISLSLPPATNGTASKPAGNAGSGLDLATIRNRCDLLVLVHAGIRGSYQITAVRGNSAWLLPDAQLERSGVTINAHPAANVRQSSKRAGRQDSPVVVSEFRTIGMNKQVVAAFNYGALRPEARQQIHTIYFEFDGSITDAAVLVRGARILQDGFTIASRWPVLVAGDFNAGQNPAAASILTAQAVRSVDSNFWNSIFGSAP